MPIQKSNAQPLSLTQLNKIRSLQQEMARLTANIAKLMAKQQLPATRNLMLPIHLSGQVQNVGNCPSGAHLLMCSFPGPCMHSNADCWAQCSNSAVPSNTTTANTNYCYFCPTGVYPTERCD
uniref:Uncharacterized protein n=1 Tax=Romanomermis culicivorax TaxID=13658 RepID=A0A915J459_ROMCU